MEEEREVENRLASEEANAEADQLDSRKDGSGHLDEEDTKAKKTKKRKERFGRQRRHRERASMKHRKSQV
ncbi:hypothetical protein NP233_g2991 [Leucocoprinus birnbaumii]|uniref:Uncharacterized protein n=1 Tax=Leucocoprinus birnbaumii TaxID=56174 RepID=A0AAD5YYN5_9AGAR|nr:hypothetical protein NP233_g2991 [Leucocoprinus birnbaumii]